MPAAVNLWSLIVACSSDKRDMPDMDKCKAILAMRGPRFCSELSLSIEDSGVWVIEVFSHEDPYDSVTLRILPSGDLSVERKRTRNDMVERRSVSF